MELKENELFEDKYRIVKKLGQGGMGKVYHAVNVKLGNDWAIKQVSKKQSDKIDLLAEPNIMKKLNHPSLPRIFDIFENDDFIYIVLDYVEGASLDVELKEKGKFKEEQVVKWAKQICDVYTYIHNLDPHPIIYRDMKPSNLMINDDDVKVIDFGIAREFKQGSNSDTAYLGTQGYAAPEQSDGSAQTDERTDIYSLGVTLYHLITGKGPNEPPYKLLPIRTIDASLSEGLEYIIAKCTQQNPEDRYQNAEALLKDLKDIKKFSKAYKKQRALRKVKAGSSIASLAFFTFLTFSGVSEYKAEQLAVYKGMVTEGKEALSQKAFEEAKGSLEEAIDFMPDQLAGYREYGRYLIMNSQYEEAIHYIQTDVLNKVEGSETDSDIHYLLGNAFFELDDYDQATNHLKRAVELDSGNNIYYRDLAVSLARGGAFDEANRVLDTINELNLSEAISFYVQGEIQAAQKKHEAAVSSYNESLEVVEDEEVKAKAYVSLAKLYKNFPEELEDQHAEKRIAVLEEATAELQDKNQLEITELLAEAYYDKGIYEGQDTDYLNQSVEQFELLLAGGYQRAYIYKNIAILHQLMENYSESEKTLLAMRDLYPEDYTCYTQLALLYAEMENKKKPEERDYQKVLENYDLAVKYSPEGEASPELQPLQNLIAELKSNNWID